MSEHLDIDQLADILAGDDAGRPHLAGCEPCQAELTALEQALPAVSAALAGVPLLAPPADLDERLARARQPRAVVGTADRRHRTRSRWVRPLATLSGIAAVAALVFGGIVVLGDGKGATPGRTTANRAGGVTHTSSTGSAYRKDGKLLAQELPALLSGAAADKVASPMIAPKGAAPLAGGGQPQAGDPLARLRTTAGLASCISSLTDPGKVELPLALDYATFEGKPALVVVLPSPKAGRVDVFVVGSTCTAADAGLLYFRRFAQP